MFVTKKQLKKAIDNINNRVDEGAAMFMALVKPTMQQFVQDEVSHQLIKRADEAEAAKKAKPDEGRCECPGCAAWRKKFPAGSVTIAPTGGMLFHTPKVTIDCWGQRIADLEGKLAALLQHQGVEAKHVPESKTAAHWEAVPVAGPVAPDNRPRKGTRKRR